MAGPLPTDNAQREAQREALLGRHIRRTRMALVTHPTLSRVLANLPHIPPIGFTLVQMCIDTDFTCASAVHLFAFQLLTSYGSLTQPSFDNQSPPSQSL